MASTRQSMSTSSSHLEPDFRMMQDAYFLEIERQQWLNDPQAQKEYREWLQRDRQKRSLLPDPLQSK